MRNDSKPYNQEFLSPPMLGIHNNLLTNTISRLSPASNQVCPSQIIMLTTFLLIPRRWRQSTNSRVISASTVVFLVKMRAIEIRFAEPRVHLVMHVAKPKRGRSPR